MLSSEGMYNHSVYWSVLCKQILYQKITEHEVKSMYYRHLLINHKYLDYHNVWILKVGFYDKAPFRTINKSLDYAGVLINQEHTSLCPAHAWFLKIDLVRITGKHVCVCVCVCVCVHVHACVDP